MLFLIKGLISKCSMSQAFTIRLLMPCLACRMPSWQPLTQRCSSLPSNPLELCWGSCIMSLRPSAWARQPSCAAWSMERLIVERSITLGCALDVSTQAVYSSALNSYLTFCQLHHLDSQAQLPTFCCYTSPSCPITLSLTLFAPTWLGLSPSLNHPIPLFVPTGFCLLLSTLSREHCVVSLALCARNHPSLEMTSHLSINIFLTHCLMTTCCLSPSYWLVSLGCCA